MLKLPHPFYLILLTESVILEIDVAATQHRAEVARPSLWRRAEAYVYLLPAVLFVAIFLLYPAFYTLYISFTDWDIQNFIKEIDDTEYYGMDCDKVQWLDFKQYLQNILDKRKEN